MSTEKMREDFEAWICGMWPGVSISRNPDNAAMFAGSYHDERVHMAWKGWQASRAAIEVELPDRFFTGHGMDISWLKDEKNPRYFDSYDDISYSMTVEAIESLGLKVKP